jgi:hypothetical protein
LIEPDARSRTVPNPWHLNRQLTSRHDDLAQRPFPEDISQGDRLTGPITHGPATQSLRANRHKCVIDIPSTIADSDTACILAALRRQGAQLVGAHWPFTPSFSRTLRCPPCPAFGRARMISRSTRRRDGMFRASPDLACAGDCAPISHFVGCVCGYQGSRYLTYVEDCMLGDPGIPVSPMGGDAVQHGRC